MDTNSFNAMMDIIVLLAGLYILYGYYLLTVKKELKHGLLVSDKFPAETCKDRDAYGSYIGLPTLLLGIAGVASGGIGLYKDYAHAASNVVNYANIILYFALLAALVFFIVRTKQAQKQFW